MLSNHYDLIVIGSGPAGEKGAVRVAYWGKKVALIERAGVLGGVALGLMALETRATLNNLINLCFNFPSLADMYKYAAYDALGKFDALVQLVVPRFAPSPGPAPPRPP
ncbi:MAG: FAD-dependent oxidoreductase [Gammaproteobacteria bacterium]